MPGVNCDGLRPSDSGSGCTHQPCLPNPRSSRPVYNDSKSFQVVEIHFVVEFARIMHTKQIPLTDKRRDFVEFAEIWHTKQIPCRGPAHRADATPRGYEPNSAPASDRSGCRVHANSNAQNNSRGEFPRRTENPVVEFTRIQTHRTIYRAESRLESTGWDLGFYDR